MKERKLALEWAISGKYDMASTCGRFKILDRIVSGTRTYTDVVGRKLSSRRLFVLDRTTGKMHVLLPAQDPTLFAGQIVSEEAA